MGWVIAAVKVLGIKLHAFGVGNHILPKQRKVFRFHAFVVVPPDFIFGVGIADNKFILC